jgi:prepilin signal peptidase PulO-like enzyme (type II secretory pathway)
MYLAIRFIFGLAIGSFLNVLVTRYNPDKFLLTKKTIGGRSICPKCKHELSWYELIPLISFAIQGGKCRNCKTKISWLYPLGELTTGLILAFVPDKIAAISYPAVSFFSPEVVLWILIFITLQLLAFIDFRLQIVPDEGSLALIILGALATFVYSPSILGVASSSFVGHYALLFGFQGSLWTNRLLALVLLIVFFGLLSLITKGRGIGMGDLKLSLGLALVFGWPDAVIAIGFAFILGAVVGGLLLLFKGKTMKTAVPFVPFIALGAVLVFLLGFQVVDKYFGLLYI